MKSKVGEKVTRKAEGGRVRMKVKYSVQKKRMKVKYGFVILGCER